MSIRISVINDEHFPSKGADTVNVMRTAAALGEAGADVNLVIPKLWENNMGFEELCDYYGVEPAFKLTRIPTIAPPSRTVRFEKLTHSMAAPLLSLIRSADVVYSRNVIPLLLAHLAGKPWVFETYRRFYEETPWLAHVTRFLPLKKACFRLTLTMADSRQKNTSLFLSRKGQASFRIILLLEDSITNFIL